MPPVSLAANVTNFNPDITQQLANKMARDTVLDLVIESEARRAHDLKLAESGATDDGLNIDSPVTQSPNPGGGTLHLALSVGFGQVQVVDSASSPTPAQ